MSELFKRLPRTWKIGSYKFKVHIVPSSHEKLAENNGMTLFASEEVYLDEAMTPMRAAIVVLHEAIHAINFVFGIEDGAEEEAVATQLSTGLMAFWQDNPKVMIWLNKTRRIVQ